MCVPEERGSAGLVPGVNIYMSVGVNSRDIGRNGALYRVCQLMGRVWSNVERVGREKPKSPCHPLRGNFTLM